MMESDIVGYRMYTGVGMCPEPQVCVSEETRGVEFERIKGFNRFQVSILLEQCRKGGVYAEIDVGKNFSLLLYGGPEVERRDLEIKLLTLAGAVGEDKRSILIQDYRDALDNKAVLDEVMIVLLRLNFGVPIQDQVILAKDDIVAFIITTYAGVDKKTRVGLECLDRLYRINGVREVYVAQTVGDQTAFIEVKINKYILIIIVVVVARRYWCELRSKMWAFVVVKSLGNLIF